MPQIQVEDSSVLNFFAGSTATAQANYLDTSDGTICGGEITVLDGLGSATVEVNGGDFVNSGATVRFGFGATGGKLTIQGGRFENTATAGDNTVLLLHADSESEIPGGTFVDGDITMGNATLLTIKGGDFSALEGLFNTGGGGATLTIVGTSFSESIGELTPGAAFNGPLSGTLADGSAFAVDLVKHSASDVFLVLGTQGPLTSAVCGSVPTHLVPGLPAWAVGLVLATLAAMGAVFLQRHRPAARRLAAKPHTM